MAATTTQIGELREAYRQGRENILGIPDEFERNVALAALRLEATHTYRELTTTAAGLDDQALAPLKEYVANLTGGEGIETSVAAFDRNAQNYAKKILGNLWTLLTTGMAVGVLATIADVLLVAAIAAESFGALLFGAVIAGGSGLYMILRGGAAAGQALTELWDSTWGWANRVGSAADAALAGARQVQARVLQQLARSGLPMQPFPARVRSRARLVMGFAWGAIGVAVALVAIGFISAAGEWSEEQTILKRMLEVPSAPLDGSGP